MKTLNSVLTISQDFSYGELVRENYEASPVETLYFPFFEEAFPLVENILPDAIILDIQPEDFSKCSAFLKQLLEFKAENCGDAPSIFVSESTSMVLRHLSTIQRKAASVTKNLVQREKLITLEEIELEDLIEILASNASARKRPKIALENIPTTNHPFDSMAPTQVSEMFRDMFVLLGSNS